MELSSKAIGSYRVYEEARKQSQRAGVLHALSGMFLALILALTFFVAGFAVGGNVATNMTSWASTVIAK